MARRTLLDWFDDPLSRRGTLTVVGEEPVAYERLHDEARALAGALARAGADPGRPVAFAGATSLGLVRALFAAWHAGSPAMILPLPHRAADPEAFVAGCGEAMARVGAPTVVCDDTWQAALEAGLGKPAVVHHAALAPNGPGPAVRRPQPDDVAVLQPTSGTTAQPRIVAITHANLAHYVGAYLERTSSDPEADRMMSWLPLAFDAGLSCVWVPASAGMPTVLAPTEQFVANPARWAAWLSELRITQTVSPNFGYAVAARAGLAGHDLSALRVAINGGEAINADTFAAFAAAGAPPGSLTCGYGLAESTCAAAMAMPGSGLETDAVDREALERDRRAVPGEGVTLARIGPPMPGVEIRIIDADTGAGLPERSVGEVELGGPTIAAGYVGDPEATAAARHGEWLRTGDLGYLAEGQLVLCGRLKELIVVAGRNVSPEELEWAAARADGVRPGNVIAFAAAGAERERVVVVAECRGEDAGRVRRDVATHVLDEAGVRPADVVLIAPGTLPKTPSGKLKRSLCRERYLAGSLKSLA